jgi:hypothetical protein
MGTCLQRQRQEHLPRDAGLDAPSRPAGSGGLHDQCLLDGCPAAQTGVGLVQLIQSSCLECMSDYKGKTQREKLTSMQLQGVQGPRGGIW